MSAPVSGARRWNLGPVGAIPLGEGREFDVADRRIAVFHLRDGSVRATQARCPHRDGPLADGLIGSGIVVCPFHAWKFDLGTGLAVVGDCPIAVYGAHLENGEIVVCL